MFCPIMPAVLKEVYGLRVTLLFHLFFGTISREIGLGNLLLECSLLAGDTRLLHKLHMGISEMDRIHTLMFISFFFFYVVFKN